MLDREYKVKYITSKNSFLYLSDKDLKLLEPDYLIRVSYGVCKTAYFSLGPPLNSLAAGELALSSTLARELGIVKNDVVSVSSTTRVYSVSKMNIVASTMDDYEILSILADDVQSNLLSQVRIVHDGQKLVIWISHSMHVVVDVDGVLPISPGRLEPLTEVSVMQPNQHRPTDPVQKRPSSASDNNPPGKYNCTRTVCRLLPVEDVSTDVELFRQPFNVFVSRRTLPQCPDTVSTKLLLQLRPICLDAEQLPKPVVVRVVALEDLYGDFETANVAYVHPCIFRHFCSKPGSKAILEPLTETAKPVKEVEVTTERRHFGKADELVRNYIIGNLQESPVLINSGVELTEPGGCRFVLKFDSAYLVADRAFMRSCRFTVDENELGPDEDEAGGAPTGLELNLACSNYVDVIEGVVRSAGMRFGSGRSCHSNVLLVGGKGTGKSSLAKHVGQVLSKKPSRIYTETLHCKKLKGKHVDSLLKVVDSAFVRLVYYQPSLLVLDDLEVICEKVVEGEVQTQENLHFNRISEILAETLEHYVRKNRISILATCESTGRLNERIFSSRGRHLFKSIYTCDNLNKTDRIELLKYFMKTKETDDADVDYETIGAKTEGFVVQDLIDFADRILFEVYKDDDCAENARITTRHCEEALKNSVSLSLRNVQLHTVGERDFSDVGGLEEVKKTLVECMLWPTKHSAIFDRSPLRLQSGVLLYGPPGTGKTILAGAAAKQCGLRLISVKGPELLSKYIGASEQAVRDVFQKAQSAKPCILFFDEFDSLAPRRGHDNTGVTDRVVNQFLTQLDGVESLSGVCVLAATSRPDLLDPALLRPGRLDRQILCPMPDREARLAILRALSKSMPLSKDVDLSEIADATTGYSGADLQAVLYTAQLSSVEHILNSVDNKTKTEECPVTRRHLEAAVDGTRPSLTRDEKLKYEAIYNRFQGKGDLLDIMAGKQKTTLA